MTSHLLEPAEIKASAWMTSAQRSLFRRLIKAEAAANHGVSLQKLKIFEDFICADTRLDALRETLAKETAAASSFASDKARVLALHSQLNSLVTLRQKLGAQI